MSFDLKMEGEKIFIPEKTKDKSEDITKNAFITILVKLRVEGIERICTASIRLSFRVKNEKEGIVRPAYLFSLQNKMNLDTALRYWRDEVLPFKPHHSIESHEAVEIKATDYETENMKNLDYFNEITTERRGLHVKKEEVKKFFADSKKKRVLGIKMQDKSVDYEKWKERQRKITEKARQMYLKKTLSKQRLTWVKIITTLLTLKDVTPIWKVITKNRDHELKVIKSIKMIQKKVRNWIFTSNRMIHKVVAKLKTQDKKIILATHDLEQIHHSMMLACHNFKHKNYQICEKTLATLFICLSTPVLVKHKVHLLSLRMKFVKKRFKEHMLCKEKLKDNLAKSWEKELNIIKKYYEKTDNEKAKNYTVIPYKIKDEIFRLMTQILIDDHVIKQFIVFMNKNKEVAAQKNESDLNIEISNPEKSPKQQKKSFDGSGKKTYVINGYDNSKSDEKKNIPNASKIISGPLEDLSGKSTPQELNQVTTDSLPNNSMFNKDEKDLNVDPPLPSHTLSTEKIFKKKKMTKDVNSRRSITTLRNNNTTDSKKDNNKILDAKSTYNIVSVNEGNNGQDINEDYNDNTLLKGGNFENYVNKSLNNSILVEEPPLKKKNPLEIIEEKNNNVNKSSKKANESNNQILHIQSKDSTKKKSNNLSKEKKVGKQNHVLVIKNESSDSVKKTSPMKKELVGTPKASAPTKLYKNQSKDKPNKLRKSVNNKVLTSNSLTKTNSTYIPKSKKIIELRTSITQNLELLKLEDDVHVEEPSEDSENELLSSLETHTGFKVNNLKNRLEGNHFMQFIKIAESKNNKYLDLQLKVDNFVKVNKQKKLDKILEKKMQAKKKKATIFMPEPEKLHESIQEELAYREMLDNHNKGSARRIINQEDKSRNKHYLNDNRKMRAVVLTLTEMYNENPELFKNCDLSPSKHISMLG